MMASIKYVVVTDKSSFYENLSSKITEENPETQITRVDTMREGFAILEASGSGIILADIRDLVNEFPLFEKKNKKKSEKRRQLSSSGNVKADLGELKAYIRKNLSADLSLENLAKHACLSPNYLSALFKAKEGMSIRQYVEVNRMDRAKYLLLTEDTMVADIAKRVGYSHCSYFCKAFKRCYNISPLQYRIRNKRKPRGYRMADKVEV